MSYLAFPLLAQLIDTLMHYPCTVALTGLADWSAILELVLPTTTEIMGPMEGTDVRYGSDIHSCVSETSLSPSRLVCAYD